MSSLDYDVLIDRAMRDIVKYALKKAQKIKDDNFCFLFVVNTKNKNVVLPDYIKKQYPEEITLILQHQFSNLDVKTSNFSVDLSFSGKIERIVIPFNSLLMFSDKMAGIELNFNYFNNDFFIYEEEYEEEVVLQNNENNLINFNDLRKKNDL